jgi:hypothetical protein
MTMTSALSASSFLASIGVNASIDYTDGKYANIKTVLADLSYIGVSLIRTAAYWPGMQGQGAYDLAAAEGIRFDMLLYTSNALPNAVTYMAAFAKAHPGALVAIEGPNEINNFPASYMGMTGAAAAVAYQNALYADVAANPVLHGTTVYSYTMNAGATSTTGYDYAAIHPYAQNGAAPLRYLDSNLATVPAGKPFVETETGYTTLPDAAGGVDPQVQAIYDLDAVFDAKAAGAGTVFLYELLDAYPDPSGTLAGNHFGLFDYANNPKPVATALHNLTQILAGGQAGLVPGGLSFSISGADATAHSLLLQKANSQFDLVLWDEQPLWNSTTHREIAPLVHSEAIRFARLMSSVAVYDPMQGTAPIAVYHDVASVVLAVGSDPLIVEATAVPTQTPVIVAARQTGSAITADAPGTIVVGTPGATIEASGTHDTFVFHTGFGIETIDGFAPATVAGDVIEFDRSMFADFAAVQGAMHASGDNLVISYDAHNTLVLDHVSAAQLSSANFRFV